MFHGFSEITLKNRIPLLSYNIKIGNREYAYLHEENSTQDDSFSEQYERILEMILNTSFFVFSR